MTESANRLKERFARMDEQEALRIAGAMRLDNIDPIEIVRRAQRGGFNGSSSTRVG